jgi:hypothetical protein
VSDCTCPNSIQVDDHGNTHYGATSGINIINRKWPAVVHLGGCMWVRTFYPFDVGLENFGTWNVTLDGCSGSHLSGTYNELFVSLEVVDATQIDVLVTLIDTGGTPDYYDYVFDGNITGGTGCIHEDGTLSNDIPSCSCATTLPGGCWNWNVGGGLITISLSTA